MGGRDRCSWLVMIGTFWSGLPIMWWRCWGTGSCRSSAVGLTSTWSGEPRSGRPPPQGGLAPGRMWPRGLIGGAGPAGAQRAARKELQRLERQIDRLSSREKELIEQLAAHASDYTALVELGDQLREVQAERARLEEIWLAVAEDAG